MNWRMRLRHFFTLKAEPHDWVHLGDKGIFAHWECKGCGKRVVYFKGVSPWNRDMWAKYEKRNADMRWP
jgi:hypothetical protein